MITRIITVGPQRLGNLLLTLYFDHWLEPQPTHTVIITPLDKTAVSAAIQHCHPELSHSVINDQELVDIYPAVDQWQDPANLRGGWLRQQALKLAALDWLSTEIMLIQDPDTFCIKPYTYWHNDCVGLFVQLNQSHYDGYYQSLSLVLGITRQTPHSYVSEFMPVTKHAWGQCKQRIESVINRHWLHCIELVPWQWLGKHRQVRWFSEYELLGNWQQSLGPVHTVIQKRFVYNNLDALRGLNTNYNTVCDRGINGQVKGLPGLFSNQEHVHFDTVNQALQLIKDQLTC